MNTTITSGQLGKFLELLEQKSMTPERFQKAWGRIAKALSNYNKTGNFRFSVDHSMTLEQMIAFGHYGWTNPDITAERFQIKGKGIVEYEACYFDFPDGTSSEEAVEVIVTEDSENPWAPAMAEHTLSFGGKFPEEQRKHPVVGLGSGAGVFGSRRVLCLWGDSSERGLVLHWFDYRWGGFYRFLAVRKVLVS